MIAAITNLVGILLWALVALCLIKTLMAMLGLVKHGRLDVSDEDGEKYLYWHSDRGKISRRFFEWIAVSAVLIVALSLFEQKF